MESWNHMSCEAVRAKTPEVINRRIDARVEETVSHLAERDRAAMTDHLCRLDGEWDLERVVSVVAAVGVLGGVLIGGGRQAGRLLAGVVAGLLLQQGLWGTSPLAEAVRRLGVRTRREVDLERFALKALRGDFSRIPHEGGPRVRANAALVAAQA